MTFADKGRLARNVIVLGAISGIRSMAGPTVLAQVRGNQRLHRARRAVDTLAVLEATADKVAPLPPRTEPAPLIARALSGAAAGFLFARRSRVAFALLGAASAVAATIAVVKLRRAATKRLGVPDFVVGLAEDAVVVAGGAAVLAR